MYLNYDYSYDAVIKSNARQWEVFRFNVLQNGSWINIKIPNKIKSFTISDCSTDGSNITMGSVAGSKIVLNLKNMTPSDANLFDEGSRFYMSLNVSDPNVHQYYSQLTSVRYVVDSVVKKKKSNGNYEMTITAYDYSYAMTDEYVASGENLTALQVVTEIATKYGLSVDASVSEKIRQLGTSFSSMTFAPLQGFTCKQTLGYMAGCFGCFARINSALKVCFEWYETATDSLIGKDRIYADGLSYKEERTIQLLETGTKDNPIVVPDNASGHSINFENPYITKELADAIYDKKIKGGLIHYSVGKVRYKGNPVNMSGKIVTTTDITGNTTPFYIMKRTLNFDGGLSETIECLGESETTINFKITSPTQQKIDRALSRMEEAIKKATDIITQTKGSIFEVIPIDENDPSKGNSGWKLYSTEIGRNNLIMANSSGIGFSSNGGQSFNAMALYIDENGIGHINANCIDVGKLSADVIDTSTLVVSKGNVDGLDNELADLLKAAEDAESKANTAQNIANDASSTASSALSTANTAKSTANTASSNASNALSVANSANGKIANWASANDTTLIDGAKIYTGSITAKQIATESITADKLSVGTGVALNQFYNDEFYDGTRGWYVYNGTLTAQGTNQSWAYMQLKPNDAYQSALMQKVWLVNGKRYSLSAQIYPLNWSYNNSNVYISYFIGGIFSTKGQDLSNAPDNNGETVVKFVFDYKEQTGFVDLGIGFKGVMENSYTPCTINIAWISLSEATGEEKGFYCTRQEWLASGYKDSNYLGGSVNNNTTADTYLTQRALTVDTSGNLVTLGTIKSNSGEIGSMVYSRDRMDITTHSYYKYVGLPTFASSRISFINPLEYYEFTATSPSYKNSAEEGQRLSARIEVASSARIKTDSEEITGDEYTMITSSGVSVSDSSGHSSITAYGINIDGVSLTKSELESLKRLI